MNGKSKYAIILASVFLLFTAFFLFAAILGDEKVPLFFKDEKIGEAILKKSFSENGKNERVFSFDKSAVSFLNKNFAPSKALVFRVESSESLYFALSLDESAPISVSLDEKSADVSAAFSSSNLRGFKISNGVKITKISLDEAKGGFDLEVAPHFYGFLAARLLDFSNAGKFFLSQHAKSRLMAEIAFKLENSEKENVRLDFGGEGFLLTLPPEKYEGVFQCALLENPFSPVKIKSGKNFVKKLILRENTALPEKNGALVSDLELILSGRRDKWRRENFEFYRWDRFRNVFFLDFRDYKEQSDFFLRLSYFAEKFGFRTRLLNDAELSGKHSYNAHDYNLSTVAAFFSEAEKQNFPLNEKEILLRSLLTENDILKEENGKFTAGAGALISISMQSQRWLRRTFLNHEGWHAVHFVDKDLQNEVSKIYKNMDAISLEFLKTYWKSYPSLQYDVNYEPLMQTEFLAYLMQQPLRECQKYFLHLVKRMQKKSIASEICDYIEKENAESFYIAASKIDGYVKKRWALEAGRISLTTRE